MTGAKLKVFVVNYDGKTKRMVATTSQKDAAERMKVPLSRLREYGGETFNADDVKLATDHPGMVMEKSMRHGATWHPKDWY